MSTKLKGLGRGLDALLDSDDGTQAGPERLATAKVGQLGPGRYQPRTRMDETSLQELAASIKKHIPEFVCTYEPDFRQAIADSWPMSLDDSAARAEWGWKPAYDLETMTSDMLDVLGRRHREGKL